jgi:hypothetical protein
MEAMQESLFPAEALPSPPPGMFPDHGPELPAEIHDLIRRAHWQSARSVAKVAPHQYVVIGWDKDELTSREFCALARLFKERGRLEEWTVPEGFYSDGIRRRMQNRYLYIGDYSYWFTEPRNGPPMLNREHVSVQMRSATRPTAGVTPSP